MIMRRCSASDTPPYVMVVPSANVAGALGDFGHPEWHAVLRASEACGPGRGGFGTVGSGTVGSGASGPGITPALHPPLTNSVSSNVGMETAPRERRTNCAVRCQTCVERSLVVRRARRTSLKPTSRAASLRPPSVSVTHCHPPAHEYVGGTMRLGSTSQSSPFDAQQANGKAHRPPQLVHLMKGQAVPQRLGPSLVNR